MRLWTIHPKYLDSKGLVALWREGLLARKVLEGKTRGYRNHPQLVRFRTHPDTLGFVTEYLREIFQEADNRGYSFDISKLPRKRKMVQSIAETQGQLDYEWQHLLQKLSSRDKNRYNQLVKIHNPDPHPLFRIVPGRIQHWEKT